MNLRRHIVVLGALIFLCALPLAAQYRDDQFRRDAFTQTYADTTQKSKTDTTKLFSFKEFFGGLAHTRTASLKTLTMGSAVFIGANQVYHRQYWKLPIIYAGIGTGIGLGVHFGNMYNSTGDERYKTYSTISYVGAGLTYWGSLMDGAVMYKDNRKPSPAKSTVYSILLPGLGQIYNGEFWKVPLYYALMAGAVHFYIDNNTQYKRWKWIHNMATTTEEVEERPPQSGETAKYYRDMYRRFRDYSILAIAAFYLLQVIDANVFAYMQEFEVDDNISMKIQPTLMQFQYAQKPALGVSMGLRF